MKTDIERKIVPARKDDPHNRALHEIYPDSLLRIAAVGTAGYLLDRNFHLDVNVESLPDQGPMIVIFNHTTLLDVPILNVADPYFPSTAFPVKIEMYKGLSSLLIAPVLRSLGALPVARDGHDDEVAKAMIEMLKKGRTLCIAVEGTRSLDGHLASFDENSVRFILTSSRRYDVPVYPIAVIGGYEALPKGSFLPRKHDIQVISGERIDLSNLRLRDLSPAAQCMRDSLVALLPPRYHPLPGTPLVENKKKPVKAG